MMTLATEQANGHAGPRIGSGVRHPTKVTLDSDFRREDGF